HRQIGRGETPGKQRLDGVAKMLAVGKRGDRLPDHWKGLRGCAHRDHPGAFCYVNVEIVPMTAEPIRDSDPPAPPAAASPVMAQYHEIKRGHPDCLLFFRMGDFYELFFEDAQAAAPALDIALTKRGRHDGADI